MVGILLLALLLLLVVGLLLPGLGISIWRVLLWVVIVFGWCLILIIVALRRSALIVLRILILGL